ncbi:2,3-butanediol dehydrogenase [Oceanobacillus sp. FSL W7-1293]|uniref:2,3-butanediol dehydrogenase n=1 Tax=Oceanobacillus sp. FSL W7-1293 TaxID=2921699 RepID=UPI0030D4AB5A
MKAARIYAEEDVRVEDVEVKEVGAKDVKVEVAWTGICGSDLHAYSHFVGIPTEEHPISKRQAPLTLGHEFSGTVTEVGSSVTSFKPGDRVCIEPNLRCGECKECREGNYHLCRNSNAAFIGLADDGGFAEYCVMEEQYCHQIPDHMTLEQAALVEPTAVTYHGVEMAGVKAGDAVLVTGAGPIGLLTVLSARAAGASKVFVSDVSKERLALAETFGFVKTLNPAEDDVIGTIMEDTNGDGVDVALECAGVQPTFDTCLEAIKRTGTVCVLAIFGQNPEINAFASTIKEANIKFSLAYSNIYDRVINLIASGQIPAEKVVTNKIKLDNIVEEGFELLLNDKSQSKILVSTK